MYTYGKRKSRISNISRIYNFENSRNGGLGPGFFIKKNISNPLSIINQKLHDLSIHIILSKEISYDLTNLIQKNNTYNLNINKYLVNLLNINNVKTNIKNDQNRRFLILDSTTAKQFSELEIPFFIYDDSNNNINTLISIINSILFYKIEEKFKI
jgi:hypothetical protein